MANAATNTPTRHVKPGRLKGGNAREIVERTEALEDEIAEVKKIMPKPKGGPPTLEQIAEWCQLVRDKTRLGACVKPPNDPMIEVHSVDDWAVYVFPERKGNGDKSRCKVVPVEKFVEWMGWV